MEDMEVRLKIAGYTKMVTFKPDNDETVNRFIDMLKASPHYADHALVYNEIGEATVYARKIPAKATELQYRAAIVERIDVQTTKGLDKYGTLLQDNPLNIMARMEYLAEELTDGLVYIEHAKRGVASVFDGLSGIVARLLDLSLKVTDDDTRSEVRDLAIESNSLLGKVMGYEGNEPGRKEGN